MGTLSQLSSCKSSHDSCAQTLITRLDHVCLQLLSWQRKTNTLTSPSSPFLFPTQDNCSPPLSPHRLSVCVRLMRERQVCSVLVIFRGDPEGVFRAVFDKLVAAESSARTQCRRCSEMDTAMEGKSQG